MTGSPATGPRSGRRAVENPFRSARIEALRFRHPGFDRRDLLRRFDTLGRRAALVGPHGSGKTTLLEELEGDFVAAGWRIERLRFAEERRGLDAGEWARVDGLGAECLLTVDGAEQLLAWSWWRLRWRSRRAGGLLVTTHRPGRLATLHRHHPSREVLVELVEELVGSEELPSPAALGGLFRKHRGNLRECLRELYDEWSAGEAG